MLVEFSVKNFRSYRERQTLSLIATSDKTHIDRNCIRTKFARAKYVHRAAVIYGANASGKTNLLTAMTALWWFLNYGGRVAIMPPAATNPFAPFKLSEETIHEPSEIEVTFIEDEVLYTYGFAFQGLRIVRESLHAQENRKMLLLYERVKDPSHPDKDIWSWGSSLRGKKSLWAEATSINTLLIATNASQNSDQLRVPHNWLSKKLRVYTGLNKIPSSFSDSLMETDKKSFMDLLKLADPSIVDAEWEDQPQQSLPLVMGNVALVNKNRALKFFHETPISHKRARFDFEVEESDGFKRAYDLFGNALDGLRSGVTFFTDEIGTSLHPGLLRRLIEMFEDPEINKYGAQLIMITHDTAQLTPELFRRDQIWFVEKNEDSASQLFPLTDFKPRKQEALMKGYLSGRYGAIPFPD